MSNAVLKCQCGGVLQPFLSVPPYVKCNQCKTYKPVRQ